MQTKRILGKCLLSGISISVLLFSACKSDTDSPAIRQQDFFTEFDSLSVNGISVAEFRDLKKKHGRFFMLWLDEILDFGKFNTADDSALAGHLTQFAAINKPVFEVVKKHYRKANNIRKETARAIAKLQDLLGGIKEPVLYSYFSQFSNYNTFIDTFGGKTIFAYSAEMFMDDTFALYKALDVPEFYNRYNHTSQVPAMLIWNYLKSTYEPADGAGSMLEEAVFNGKIWFTMKMTFPDSEPWNLFGYTDKEWKQMTTEEGQIWKHYLDNNMLFQTDFNKYKRYFSYGTHTFGAGIPSDCPPLIGNFTGYRIVSAYMEKNNKNLKELWKEKDASRILRESGYNPIK